MCQPQGALLAKNGSGQSCDLHQHQWRVGDADHLGKMIGDYDQLHQLLRAQRHSHL
ncbi:hypothetical protein [Bradyrhizobium sp. SZCCHNR1015]|uniref:hypothetical protein n=1 Tax=Bradyrhizobium sp. SZCCHNR1015 TaxID=3057338 RepID=UPI003966D55C